MRQHKLFKFRAAQDKMKIPKGFQSPVTETEFAKRSGLQKMGIEVLLTGGDGKLTTADGQSFSFLGELQSIVSPQHDITRANCGAIIEKNFSLGIAIYSKRPREDYNAVKVGEPKVVKSDRPFYIYPVTFMKIQKADSKASMHTSEYVFAS